MRLLAPVVLTTLIVPACQNKPEQPKEPGTSGTTNPVSTSTTTEPTPTTMIPITESTLVTSIAPGTEPATISTTGSTTGTVTDTSSTDSTGSTSGGVPWDPVECDGIVCKEGEVCHHVADRCVSYEPESAEGCLDGCYEIDYGYYVCTAIPSECQDAPNLTQCILDTLCGDNGCFEDNTFVEGLVECKRQFCHCGI